MFDKLIYISYVCAVCIYDKERERKTTLFNSVTKNTLTIIMWLDIVTHTLLVLFNITYYVKVNIKTQNLLYLMDRYLNDEFVFFKCYFTINTPLSKVCTLQWRIILRIKCYEMYLGINKEYTKSIKFYICIVWFYWY